MENQDPRGSPNKGRQGGKAQGAKGERDGEPRGSPNKGRQGDREWRTKRQTHTQMENHEREREKDRQPRRSPNLYYVLCPKQVQIHTLPMFLHAR